MPQPCAFQGAEVYFCSRSRFRQVACTRPILFTFRPLSHNFLTDFVLILVGGAR